jgi:hypothetical protein
MLSPVPVTLATTRFTKGPAMRDFPETWCRMWNDEPDLAYDLAADDFRMWTGKTDMGDQVHGPAGLARSVDDFRREKGIRFTPRRVAADEQTHRLAFTWDAVYPDGSVVSGIDICTLHAGLIVENWTVPGQRPASMPEEAGGAAYPPASRADAETLRQAWSPLWNGDTDRAGDVVTDDFRIWFGAPAAAADDLVGPAELAAYIRGHRRSREGLRFAEHRAPVIDLTAQTVAWTWSASMQLADGGQRSVGGIDLFQLTGARFNRCWSVTGSRPFTF